MPIAKHRFQTLQHLFSSHQSKNQLHISLLKTNPTFAGEHVDETSICFQIHLVVDPYHTKDSHSLDCYQRYKFYMSHGKIMKIKLSKLNLIGVSNVITKYMSQKMSFIFLVETGKIEFSLPCPWKRFLFPKYQCVQPKSSLCVY